MGYISGTVAFGIVTASLIGSVFLIYASVSPALPISNDSTLNDDGATDGIEFYYEARTDVLLNRGAFLKENDVVTFDLRIPDKNVTTMDGVISVQSMAYFDIEFRNSTGALYCDQCKIRVYGDQSGRELTETQNDIRINVKRGDFIKLVIINPESTLQTVHVLLQVSYLEQKQRIIAPVLNNNTDNV